LTYATTVHMYTQHNKFTLLYSGNNKPLQLGLSLVERNTEITLLACIESKFSTFFYFKNVRKIKKTLKT